MDCSQKLFLMNLAIDDVTATSKILVWNGPSVVLLLSHPLLFYVLMQRNGRIRNIYWRMQKGNHEWCSRLKNMRKKKKEKEKPALAVSLEETLCVAEWGYSRLLVRNRFWQCTVIKLLNPLRLEKDLVPHLNIFHVLSGGPDFWSWF